MNSTNPESTKTAKNEDAPLAVTIYLAFLLIVIYNLVTNCIGKKQSKRVGPITEAPIIPFPQENLFLFQTTAEFRNYIPEVKIQCETPKKSWFNGRFPFHQLVHEKMHEWMHVMYGVEHRMPDEYEHVLRGKRKLKVKNCVPGNAKTISIKKDGFKHGTLCHDFEPIHGPSTGSHFTYQMFGANRIQVTYYWENGKSYIAGFCIYIEDNTARVSHYSDEVFKWLWNSEGYPRIAEQPKDNELRCVKYCSKKKRYLISRMENGGVVHEEWKTDTGNIEKTTCESCTQDHSEEMDLPPEYSTLSTV